MGGLAARNYAAQKWYSNYRNREQGQFHEIITLDTPELGSNLASSLIDHKDCLGHDDYTKQNYSQVWGSFCDGPGFPPAPLHLTVAQCLAGLPGLPLALYPAHPEDGVVYSLIPPTDPRGKAIKNLLGPNIPGADWRAITATKPPNSALGAFVDGIIKGIISPSTVPYCPSFNTPQTLDGVLGTPNDAIVTLASQSAGISPGIDHSQVFPNLSHTGVPWLLDILNHIFLEGLINDNVEDSPDVWHSVCHWLSPNSTCHPDSGTPAETGFHADEFPVARIPLVVQQTPAGPLDPRNPTLRLQPWNVVSISDGISHSTIRVYSHDTSKAHFTIIDPPSGSPAIQLEATNGIIHPLKVGTATVQAQYTIFDPGTNRSVTLTSQIQVNVVDKQQ